MLLGETSRPRSCRKIFKGLGFADALERLAEGCLDDIQRPQSDFAICVHPIAQILAKFRMKNS